MDLSPAVLFASFVTGSVGMAFFMYGKKEVRMPQLVTGLALMVYPYFVGSALAIWGIGAALVAGLWLGLRMGL